ncbi:MAG TPA: amidohydrolase family protein, partial [Anseongella sp.]|nr:amidohydrolase family protein [Anseongella sp.]
VLLFWLAQLTDCLLLNAQPQPLVFTHATVIDMTGQPPKADRTVIIEGNRITATGHSDSIQIPGKARIVNASGKFLIPGLWDAHVHLSKAGEKSFPLFICNGITGVRDMGGDLKEILQWKNEIARGSRTGPRIKTAGPMLESAGNVERMKREASIEPVERTRAGISGPPAVAPVIDSLAKLGVDFLKVRTVSSLAAYRAIAQAAREKGLLLTGHVIASPEITLQAGQRSLEHSFFPPLDSLSKEERFHLFKRMAKNDVYVVPTLITGEGFLVPAEKAAAIVEDRYGKLDSRRKYLSGYLIDDWREQVAELQLYPFDWEQVLSGRIRDLREMRQQGVRFMAGTDVAVMLVYPGFSLHEELQLLVSRIGMTPMEALLSATRHPAEFFGMQDSLGTIEANKIADLVLLEANPLEDIGNTQKINCVVTNGRYYSRKDLKKLLAATSKGHY